MKIWKLLIPMVFSAGVIFFAGCGGGGGTSGNGELSVYLTDVSSDDYQAIYVTVDEVSVHKGDVSDEAEDSGWQVVATPGRTYNLLELVNGAMEQLGTEELATGHYTQLRMKLKDTPDDGINLLGQPHPYPNYLIDKEDSVHELTIPSGFQTGIKLVHSFDIVKGLTVELILDFDATKSVVQAGSSGKYNLKPTIKVIGTKENAIVSGIITDDDDNVLSGVLVTAQTADPAAEDPAEQVNVATSTLTDENGQYSMYLSPGDYLIAAFKGPGSVLGTAYGPGCGQLTAELNTSYTKNFQLGATRVGQVFITVFPGEEMVFLSIRKSLDCGAGGQSVEISSLAIDEYGEYGVSLPGGETDPVAYTMAAYDGETTRVADIDVLAGENTTVTFDFSATP